MLEDRFEFFLQVIAAGFTLIEEPETQGFYIHGNNFTYIDKF
jgi:hypothetical protein